MRQKENSVRKGGQKRGETCAHSTPAVASSWPFFFCPFSNTQGWPVATLCSGHDGGDDSERDGRRHGADNPLTPQAPRFEM